MTAGREPQIHVRAWPGSRTRHLATVVAVVALAVALGGCGAGASSPAASASQATPLPTTVPATPASAPGTDTPPIIATDGTQATRVDTPFESARYRYRLVVPPGWTINEAPGSGGLHPDEPGVDTFRDREGHILSVIGEPADQLDGWASAIDLHLRGEHRLAVESEDTLTLAGVPGRLREYHLPIPPSYLIHYLDAALVSDGLGRVLSLESTTRDDPGDRAVLDRFLSTLEVERP